MKSKVNKNKIYFCVEKIKNWFRIKCFWIGFIDRGVRRGSVFVVIFCLGWYFILYFKKYCDKKGKVGDWLLGLIRV